MYEVVANQNADREGWLALRRSGIGGSEIAAVLGISPWSSAFSVYAEKIGEAVATPDNEQMKWGRILEPVVAAEAAAEIREAISSVGRMRLSGDMLRSVEHPVLLATLDAVLEDDAGTPLPLEVKVTARAGDWHDGVPAHYAVQVQHQLAVTGAPRAYIAALIGGNRLVWEEVPRNEDFILGTLIPAARKFWQRVEDRIPPAADGSEATKAALAALYPRDTGEVIALPGHFLDLDAERQTLSEQIASHKARLDAINNEIRAALGDASVGVLPDGTRYSCKWQERRSYTVPASEGRVLRRSAAKGGK